MPSIPRAPTPHPAPDDGPHPAAPTTGLQRFRDFVCATEALPWGPGSLAVALAGTIAMRNLLEIAVSANPIFKALAAFIHYPLAYVAPFLGLTLVLAAWSRVPPGRVARLMVLAWFLTLLPPLVDLVLHRAHQSPTIGYLQVEPQELPWVVLRFFDPTATLPGTTAGIRVETLLACLLGAFYVWLRSGRAVRAAGAFVSIYATSLFFFTLPTLVFGIYRMIEPAATIEDFFRARGALFQPDPSTVPDSIAIFWLVPVLGLLAALWRGLEASFPDEERWTKPQPARFEWALPAAFLVPLALAGAMAAMSLTLDRSGRSVRAAFDAFALAAVPVALALAFAAIALRGVGGAAAALGAVALAAALGRSVTVAIAASAGSFALLAAGLVTERWRRPFLVAANAIAALGAFAAGYAVVIGPDALARLPFALSVAALVAGLLQGLLALALSRRPTTSSPQSLWARIRSLSCGFGLGCLAWALLVVALLTPALVRPWREQARCVARLVRFEAVKLMQEKRWADAKPLFEQALACEPKDVESLRGLGLIALRTDKDLRGAIARFEQALAVAPESVEELTNLGAAYLEAKRLEDAARVLGRAVDRAPRDPNALFNRAQALTALQRRNDAIRAWQDYLAVAGALPDQAGPAAFARRSLERLQSGEPDAPPK